MKHLKMLGLLAVAVAALSASVAPALATIFTSPAGTIYTSTIEAYSFETALSGSFVTVKCGESHVKGKVETHGAGVTAGGKISSLTFTECNYPTTVKKAGSLEIHGLGGGNGTLTSTGAEIEIATSVGTCVFTTSATDIGTMTGGTPARLDIASAKIPRTGGNFLCGSSGTWNGSYTIITPGSLFAH